MGVETWLLLATVAVLAWVYSKWRHNYWTSRGVPSPPALPFIGHFHKGIFVSKTAWESHHEDYTKFYSSSMYGIYEFFSPILVTWDTEILKHILVKDFDSFTDRRNFNMRTGHERDELVAEMLSIKFGKEWKSLRALITPTFTSGKIKSMFPLLCDKADALVKFSMKQAAENPHVDMKNNFGRFTIDTIASCAFGIECNSLVNDNDEFPRKMEVFLRTAFTPVFKALLHYNMPSLFRLLSLSLNPPETDFFINVVNQTIAARKDGKKRGDFLDLMLEARDNSDDPNSKHVLSDQSIVAQSIQLMLAGYDTTASLLALSSLLLAKNKDQQQRLRDELRQMVADHGSITYQGIMEAKLLDACLQESLRLYPPVPIIERCCTKSYRLPGTDLTMKPGDIVQVPIWSLQHDPHHWPHPEAFIPDRFLSEKKGDIKPFTYMPFGMGPRNCIAMRFALLEAKLALGKLLLEAELDVAPGHEKVNFESTNALMRPKDSVILVLSPVKK